MESDPSARDGAGGASCSEEHRHHQQQPQPPQQRYSYYRHRDHFRHNHNQQSVPAGGDALSPVGASSPSPEGEEGDESIDGDTRRPLFTYAWPFLGSSSSSAAILRGLSPSPFDTSSSSSSFSSSDFASPTEAADALRDALMACRSDKKDLAGTTADGDGDDDDKPTLSMNRIAIVRSFLFSCARRKRSPSSSSSSSAATADFVLSINTPDSRDETALHFAVRAGDTALLGYLLSLGRGGEVLGGRSVGGESSAPPPSLSHRLSLFQPSAFFPNPFPTTQQQRSGSLGQFSLPLWSGGGGSGVCSTAMMMMAPSGNGNVGDFASVRLLSPSFQQSIDLGQANTNGQTALHMAAANGNAAAVALLLGAAATATAMGTSSSFCAGDSSSSSSSSVASFCRFAPTAFWDYFPRPLDYIEGSGSAPPTTATLTAHRLIAMAAASSSFTTSPSSSPSSLLSQQCGAGFTVLHHAAARGHASVVAALLPFYHDDNRNTTNNQHDGAAGGGCGWLRRGNHSGTVAPSSYSSTSYSSSSLTPLQLIAVDALRLAASAGQLGCVRLMCNSLINLSPPSCASLSPPICPSANWKSTASTLHHHASSSSSAVASSSSPSSSAMSMLFAKSPQTGQTLLHAAASSTSSDVLSYVVGLFGERDALLHHHHHPDNNDIINNTMTTINNTSRGMVDLSAQQSTSHYNPTIGTTSGECSGSSSGTFISPLRMLLNEGDSSGATPLLIAASRGCTQVVEVLLGAMLPSLGPSDTTNNGQHIHADSATSTINKNTSFHDNNTNPAEAHHHNNIINDTNTSSLPSLSVLLPSASSSITTTTTAISFLDALSRTDCSGNSALLLAAKGGHTAVVQQLHSAWGRASSALAVPLSAPSMTGPMTLSPASAYSSSSPASPFSISSSAAFVNNGNPQNGDTPLHTAALYGHTAVVRLLLSLGADPLSRSYGGTTPLHTAAQGGSADVIRALTTHRYSQRARCGNSGGAAVAAATTAASSASASASSADGSVVAAAATPQPAVLGVVDPNVKDAKGLTPLHTAVMHNNLAAVKALIEGAGAMIWGQYDEKGLDPRHYAARLTPPSPASSSSSSRFGNSNDGLMNSGGAASVFAPNGASVYRAARRRQPPPPPPSRVSQYLNSYGVRYRDAKAKGRLFLKESIAPQFYVDWCDRREQAAFAAEEMGRIAAEREEAEAAERRRRHEQQLSTEIQIQIQQKEKEKERKEAVERDTAAKKEATLEAEGDRGRGGALVTVVDERGAAGAGAPKESLSLVVEGDAAPSSDVALLQSAPRTPDTVVAVTTAPNAEGRPPLPSATANTAGTTDTSNANANASSSSSAITRSGGSSKAVVLTPREAERQRLQQRLYLAMAGIMTALSGVMVVMIYKLIQDRARPHGSPRAASSSEEGEGEASFSEGWARYDREQSQLAKQWGQQRAAFEQGLYDEHTSSSSSSSSYDGEASSAADGVGVGGGEEGGAGQSSSSSDGRVAGWHNADNNHGRGLAGDEYKLADGELPSQRQHESHQQQQQRGGGGGDPESAADHYYHTRVDYHPSDCQSCDHHGAGAVGELGASRPYVYGGAARGRRSFASNTTDQQRGGEGDVHFSGKGSTSRTTTPPASSPLSSSSSSLPPHDQRNDPYRPPPPRSEQHRPYFQTPHYRPSHYHRQRQQSAASHVYGFDAYHRGGGAHGGVVGGEEDDVAAGQGRRSILGADSVRQWVTGGAQGKAAWRARVRRVLGRGK